MMTMTTRAVIGEKFSVSPPTAALVVERVGIKTPIMMANTASHFLIGICTPRIRDERKAVTMILVLELISYLVLPI